ncbi:PAS domain-containing protein [Ferrovibrio sp.]|uniref:PAS domain-containing protein n=1 Tax=Ferrovibrio sp. TaxID=1917215 RepID=UPI002606D65B|nr:PAS domain-containing protein [Ferrovibrio sp.]
MDFLASLPAPLTAPSRSFFAQWHRWRGDRLLPRRSAMDANGLGDLRGYCLLLDIRGRDSIPICFAGNMVVELLGTDLAGRNYLDLTEPENRSRRAALLFAEIAQPCAAVIYYWLQSARGRTLPVELVSAPLCNDDTDQPSLVLACATPLVPGKGGDVMQAASYTEGEGLRFIDIGAGIPPVGADMAMFGHSIQ